MTHEHAISTYVSESYHRNNAIKAKHSKSNVCLCGAVYALERWHVIEDPKERARSLRWALSREAEKWSGAVSGIRHEEARTDPNGDGPCQDCGGPNIVWFTDSTLWNEVMRSGEFVPGEVIPGIVCIPCFVARAEKKYAPIGWRVLPEWPARMTCAALAREEAESA